MSEQVTEERLSWRQRRDGLLGSGLASYHEHTFQRWLLWIAFFAAAIWLARREYQPGSRLGLAAHVLIGRPLVYRTHTGGLRFNREQRSPLWVVENVVIQPPVNPHQERGSEKNDATE